MKRYLLKINSNGKAFRSYGRLHVDIRDFGAVCDGITDDTAAITLARSYQASLMNNSILIPKMR